MAKVRKMGAGKRPFKIVKNGRVVGSSATKRRAKARARKA